MQTLSTYLAGRKKADFARAINVSDAQLSQYLSGYRRPSYKRMLEIERLTDGQVSIQSWQHVNSHGLSAAENKGRGA